MSPSPSESSPTGQEGSELRVGVDTGGTFTDLCALDPDGALRTWKVRSTPDDPGLAIAEGLDALSLQSGGGATIVHGTTVALNAMLTGRLGEAALITNEGFLDLIEIDRQARPDLYDLEPVRPESLVPRSRRFEIGQRTWPEGDGFVEAIRPTDEEIAEVADRIAASGVTSVAVCLLHSYADPEPERRIADALRARGLSATASADLVPEYREAERFSTAVANAALVPIVRSYLSNLAARLPEANLELLQSSGGGLSAERAAEEPVRVLLSGPAGGVIGAAQAAREALGQGPDGDRSGSGAGPAIATLDMGGTSTDVAFHDPSRGLGVLGEEVRVAGHSIAVPTLDMHTIGCGGGSLARVDASGILRVGPSSAGADPGPIAFGRGGTEPTVTDAYVLLGQIPHAPHEEGFLGGTLPLDIDAVMRSFETLGSALGVRAEVAAQSVVDSANAAMRRALGVMTMQRGRDPRTTPLVAFGGGGGLAAAALADALGMPCALVPTASGVLSAAGMARASRAADRSQTVLRPIADVTGTERRTLFNDLIGAAASAIEISPAELSDEDTRHAVETGLALRYRGQSYELSVDGDAPDPAAAFHAAHEARFGWNLPQHEVQLVHARVRVTRGMTLPNETLTSRPVAEANGKESMREIGRQRATIGGQSVELPLIARTSLGTASTVMGPSIIVETTGTTFVPPRWCARVATGGGLLLKPTS